MSDDEDDPLKVITSDPVLRRQFFRSPRRQARERGAPDDRPPNGGPFENSMIDDDKEEYVAMAVWIALALFAVAVSAVVARGPHLDAGSPVLRHGDGGPSYARLLAVPSREGNAGIHRSNASRNVTIDEKRRLSKTPGEMVPPQEARRGNDSGKTGQLELSANNASVAADDENRLRTEQSPERLRVETAAEDSKATEMPIILW